MATDTKENVNLDRAKASAILDERGHACLACGSHDWLMAPDYVSPLPLRGDKYANDSAYPSVMVACAECGLVHFYNASILGLWDYARNTD